MTKAIFTVAMIDEMLRTKGPRWNREWAHYVPRIDEEFGDESSE